MYRWSATVVAPDSINSASAICVLVRMASGSSSAHTGYSALSQSNSTMPGPVPMARVRVWNMW